MARAEQEGVPYLFKLLMTNGVKKAVERLMRGAAWCEASHSWQRAETRLEGWGPRAAPSCCADRSRRI